MNDEKRKKGMKTLHLSLRLTFCCCLSSAQQKDLHVCLRLPAENKGQCHHTFK